MKTIFIGGIQRSGGSLLARLFDGHPDIASYPGEYSFPIDSTVYPIFELYTGVPTRIQSYTPGADIFSLLNIPQKRPEVILKWGQEKPEILGVRNNYLEKEYYGVVKTDFAHDKFINLFNKFARGARTLADLYAAKHKAYFAAWDNGQHAGTMKCVVWHSCSGIYLNNIESYFEEFKDSFFVFPLRDIMGYIASEKTRIARRYYGSRRFSRISLPNFFVKTFKNYDLEAQIRGWMATLTRVVLLQEKFGVNERFVVCGYENMVCQTESVMRALCRKLGLPFHHTLLEPTIGSQPWGGNSHQGKQQGINKKLTSYYPQVLSREEIVIIEEAAGKAQAYIKEAKDTPVDLTKLSTSSLTDYAYQKKYFKDKEKICLYYALVNSGRRRVMIRVPDVLAIFAYFYGKIIRIIHIPRILKLRFFPGRGRQNYT